MDIIDLLPKAELHVHIEGTLEPELLLRIAERHKIKLPYPNVEEIKKLYHFKNLQSFLNIYYQATQVLKDEEDFFDLAWEYFQKAAKQNIQHVEIFFDPQTHTRRNIPFCTVIKGLHRALLKAKKELSLTGFILACFLRDLSEKSALKTLKEVLAHQDKIIGIGLDSAELNNPPSKFKTVFNRARNAGLKLVAHAGEEGPPSYIWEALTILHVDRIDHGIKCMRDPKLVEYLANEQIPLTVCPLSNVRLKVVSKIEEHPIKEMLQKNLCVTVNSDDPAYFGGYLNDNLRAIQQSLSLTDDEIKQLLTNSFKASFTRA